MGSMFKPSTTIVQSPSQSASSGSSEVRPYAPVEPYLQQLLPAIQYYYAKDPQLYTGSLVPGLNAAQQQSQDAYLQAAGAGGLAQTASQGVQQGFQGLLSAATTPSTGDAVYQAQVGDISRQARQMSEQNKLDLQQRAIKAGQYGLGSTALGEQQSLQQFQEREAIQSASSQALQAAEARRMSAIGQLPAYAQASIQAGLTPASIYESVGTQQAAQEAARLADQARLATQEQEAIRLQLTNMANLFGGLSGLGSQTQYQQKTSGTSGTAFPGPSTLSQIMQTIGVAKSLF